MSRALFLESGGCGSLVVAAAEVAPVCVCVLCVIWMLLFHGPIDVPCRRRAHLCPLLGLVRDGFDVVIAGCVLPGTSKYSPAPPDSILEPGKL
jgi:hypothetical protein